jgi:general secretion pathway protein J
MRSIEFKRITHRPSAGFTLIEILVALLILGIMSALGYGAYRAARISAERTEESLQRSREIEFGMRVLMQDFSELAPRPVRDVLGGTNRMAALKGSTGAGTVSPVAGSLGASSGLGANSSMTFKSDPGFNSGPGLGGSGFGGGDAAISSFLDLTRAGWSNTAGQQRSTLQRVSYGLVGDVLKRSYQVNLDTVLGNKPVVQDLMKGVKGIQLRYLDNNQAWQSQWPMSSGTDGWTVRPVAVEVVIEFKDWGRVRRLLEVAG